MNALLDFAFANEAFFFFYVYSKYVIIKAVIPIWNSLHNILTKLFC